MHYSRGNAPAHIPVHEVIESLLGEKNGHRIRPLQDLTDIERKRANLVKLGKRTERIQGDPFGVWPSWAGNVGHPDDLRMFDVLEPICDKLIGHKVRVDEETMAIQKLFERIPHINPRDLAMEMATGQQISTIRDTANELVVSFPLLSKTVRLMHAKDVDKNDKKSFDESIRAKRSAQRAEELLNEQPMPIATQQYLMATILIERHDEFHSLVVREITSATDKRRNISKSVFHTLRSQAREKYWLDMTPTERANVRQAASKVRESPEPGTPLRLIQDNWFQKWNNSRWDSDYFRNYLMDQNLAANALDLVSEDIFVVVEKNLHVVFANVEGIVHSLYGSETVDLLQRAIDLWSFYTPLPSPETSRHVVDSYVRRIHPELDPSKATVETLPNAKMAVAHYGCWARRGDGQGRNIWRTYDCRMGRIFLNESEMCLRLLHKFTRAVLGKTSSITRFLAKSLDSDYYRECVEIFENLPEDARLPVDTEAEDWISLFALGINGYTQRHRDVQDISGGLAGLLTLGSYTGANLCVPQLGIKVRYAGGACAIIRGNSLDHFVEDYSGPRFFVIGTNHETCKKYSMRKLGRLPPLPSRAQEMEDNEQQQPSQRETDPGEELERPCINFGCDQDDDEGIVWTNEMIHGPAVLARGSGLFESSSESSSSAH